MFSKSTRTADAASVSSALRDILSALTLADSAHPSPAASSSSASGASSQHASSTESDRQLALYHLNFAGISLCSDATSLSLHHAFPLLRPPNSQAVTGTLLVSHDVFNVAPRTLLAYALPESTTVTDVWPDRLADDNAAARYSMYPLLEAVQGGNAKRAPLAAFNDWAAGRGLAHAHAPPMAGPHPGQLLTQIPQEMFDYIATYLSRDDFKALRLTSRLMCARTTGVFFKTIVVPFRSGMFGEELRAEMNTDPGNGESKSTATNVFERFGHHMQKFGVSYEVDEAILPKVVQQLLTRSYWGSYYWPADPNEHEDTPASAVDEIIGMKGALSKMENLKELALSIDSGLGWLSGPDKSIRSQMIHDRVDLFPGSYGLPSRRTQAQRELWDYIKSQYAARGELRHLARSRLYRFERAECITLQDPTIYSGVPIELQYVDGRTLMEANPLDGEVHAPDDEVAKLPSANGLLVTALDRDPTQSSSSYPVLPGSFTISQVGALMRVKWGQESLKDAFIMGVKESRTCRAVSSLNLASLPGRYLDDFGQPEFWKALPSLETLNVMVMGEHGEVEYDSDSILQYHTVPMSRAVAPFKKFLRDRIATLENIKTLGIGWTSGGEHATGLCGRNNNLLPAPFLRSQPLPTTMMMDDVVVFPHVQHLTIKNSWMTARGVEYLVDAHRECRLRKLTLDSVSLQVLPLRSGGQIPEQTTKVYLEQQGSNDIALDWPFRAWSWPQVLDAVSPDANFELLGEISANTKGRGALEELELISCGHSTIDHALWTFTGLDFQMFQEVYQWKREPSNSYFQARRSELEQLMPRGNDRWTAAIIPLIPRTEANALKAIWGATIGWQDEESTFAATLDGCRPGGTGRFSAVIRAPRH
ncbi:f-box domain-containing protein [Diplodia corticola]|uniref:F-box domain-containing protein n=1 Tax=Diplodia corticola TaxID=236234 RepID=A0A1J9R1J6_9PEZI|nr:f-box domain-containing protein [Diplodia corticola]OJD34488.1 f-box domain-containing protein [Diplodia corticola]